MIKLKTLLNEELLGEYLGYEIFKNPKSIKRMDADLRGISFPNGDLFVIDDGRNVVHSQLSDWLKRNKYSIPIDMSLLPELAKGIKKGYDSIMFNERGGNTLVVFDPNIIKILKVEKLK